MKNPLANITALLPHISFGKPKTSATTIDLSANPLDARPAVTQIRATIREAIAADPQRIVVAFIGMHHDSAFHHAVYKMTMQSLAAEGLRPMVTVEQSHNLLEKFAPLIPGAPDANKVRTALAALKEENPATYHRMQCLMVASLEYPMAPVSTHMTASDSFFQTDYPVRLVDLALSNSGYLDTSDPWTKQMVAQSGKDLKVSIPRESTDGKMIRVRGQLENIMEAARETRSNLVIAQVTLGNLAGIHNKIPYEVSIHVAACGKNTKFTPVSVFLESAKYTAETIPNKGLKSFMKDPHAVIVKGGDTSAFSRNEQRTMFGDLIRAHDVRPEIDKLNAIFAASGFVGDANKIPSHFSPNYSAQENRRLLIGALERLLKEPPTQFLLEAK